ncbi:transglycosylase SLT domain-containing protein [archaeon]|nr:transglycosylase SLT domain-containing protein [archaeon]
MKKEIIALLCSFLLVSTPLVSAAGTFSLEEDPRNLGEALIINVDHVEPTVIDSDYFKDNEFPVHVFLKGSTLGTFLFGGDAPATAPFFGDMKIKNIRLTPDRESLRYISGISQIKKPVGRDLVIDSSGNIDLGYTKVMFRRNPKEDELPDTLDIDVTAQVYFDVTTGFGNMGTYSLHLSPQGDKDAWLAKGYEIGEIWGGRGYLRLVSIDRNKAKFELYNTHLERINAFELTSGATAKQFTLPGGTRHLENLLSIKLDKINANPDKARLVVDNGGRIEFDKTVVSGMKIAQGSDWTVDTIYGDGIVFIDSEGNKKELENVPVPVNYVTSIEDIHPVPDYLIPPPPKEKLSEIEIKYDPSGTKTDSANVWFKYTGVRWVYHVEEGAFFARSDEKRWRSTSTHISCEGLTTYNFDSVFSKVCNKLLASDGLESGIDTLVDYANKIINGDDDTLIVIKNQQEVYKPNHGDVNTQAILQHYDLTQEEQAQTQSQTTLSQSYEYYNEAITAYEKAIAEQPTEGLILYESNLGIAKAHDSLNYPVEALKYYQRAEEYSQYSEDEFDFQKHYEDLEERISRGRPHLNLGDGIQVTLLDIDLAEEAKDSFIYTLHEGEHEANVGKFLEISPNPVDEDEDEYKWQIAAINSDSVIIQQSFTRREDRHKTQHTMTLNLKQTNLVPYNENQRTVSIFIKNIDTIRSGIVTISPGTRDNYGTSYFTIHLPIEKRLIQWTPEEIDRKIQSTDKALNKLDNVITKLRSVVKTWTYTCYTVWAFLTVKNTFFKNPFARRKAVERIEADCTVVTKGTEGPYAGMKLEECMAARNDEIEALIPEINGARDKVESAFDGYNTEKPETMQKVANELGVSTEKLQEMHEYGLVDADTLRDTILAQTAGWEESQAMITDLQSKEEIAKKITTAIQNEKPAGTLSERNIIKNQIIAGSGKEVVVEDIESHLSKEIDLNEKVVNYLSTNEKHKGKKITVNLPIYQTPEGKYYVRNTEGKKITVEPIPSQEDSKIILRSSEGDYYTDEEGTPYLSSRIVDSYSREYSGYFGNPEVYYDKDNQNRPMYIPLKYPNPVTGIPKLDFANYIEVFADSTGDYHYSIINVGENGILDIDSGGDDLIVVDSSLLKEEATSKTTPHAKLLTRIKKAYRDANVAVKEGGEVRVEGKSYPVHMLEAKTSSVMTECKYLMPKTDCKILFGVCDPVMCPVSRFNLGGTWDVGPSVIESGIIGSIVLGLPNFNIPYEPVPICLTGVNAGLENIYSMMGSYRDCLETAKVKGESVGICNEIRSVYICDILWEEALALVNVFGKLRNVIATNIFGSQSAGEIDLSWKSNWDNVQDNFNFFTKEYAKSSFAAFNARSTHEIGSELCKAAIFGRVPGSGDLLAQLTEPESPPQFTGWVREDVYTTVDRYGQQPSYGTGQAAYRVYYHIYAGRNYDIRYRVYLEDALGNKIPATDKSGFSLGGTRYLKKGESVDKSFTLTQMLPGYDKMCIEINGIKECGFGSVSSAFSMQYLKEQLIKREIGKEIKTKKDCVPDVPRYQPGITQTGIKRVCSVYDPDSVGDDWIEVGTCGYDEKERFIGDCYMYQKGITLYDTNYTVVDHISKDVLDEAEDFTVTDIIRAKQEIDALILEEQSAESNKKRGELIAVYESIAISEIDNDVTAEAYQRIGGLYLRMADREAKTDRSYKGTSNWKDTTQITATDLNSVMENCNKYLPLITKYADQNQIDYLLLLAVMIRESNCVADACGPDGCTGLMQIEPKTAEYLCGVSNVENLHGSANAEANIECGAKVLRDKYNTFKDGGTPVGADCKTETEEKYKAYREWEAALRGYNGWSCLEIYNTDYVENVITTYNQLKTMFGGEDISEYIVEEEYQEPEITGDLKIDNLCNTYSDDECDSYFKCYLKINKGIFGWDWASGDNCNECSELDKCLDIKNKEKCNDNLCSSSNGLSCKWDNVKALCIEGQGIAQTIDLTAEELLEMLGQLSHKGFYIGTMYSLSLEEYTTPIFFRHLEEGIWEWGLDEVNWMPTNEMVVSGGNWDGKQPTIEVREIINQLEVLKPIPE